MMTELQYAQASSPNAPVTWLTCGEYVDILERKHDAELELEAWKAAEWVAEQLKHNEATPTPYLILDGVSSPEWWNDIKEVEF